MSADYDQPLSHVIEAQKEAYLHGMPEPATDWPTEVRLLYRESLDRLFDEGVTAKKVVSACALRSNEVYSRFRYEVGQGIGAFIITHRVRFAKKLLDAHPNLRVTDIAYAVGYGSVSGFCTTFKRYTGRTPSEYRECEEE